MLLVFSCLMFLSSEVFSLEASLGLITINSEKIEIEDNSVFVGPSGNTQVQGPQQMWCHGSSEWNICSWIWQEKPENNCEYWDGTSKNDCTDSNINIDKEGNDCNLKIFTGFTKNDHEGAWECRLSKFNDI